MTPENFKIALRTFAKRKPFRPYTVELLSGSRIEVDHPEALVLQGDVAVYISPKQVPSVFDSGSVSRFVRGKDSS